MGLSDKLLGILECTDQQFQWFVSEEKTGEIKSTVTNSGYFQNMNLETERTRRSEANFWKRPLNLQDGAAWQEVQGKWRSEIVKSWV